jgi:hypothetical protein
LDAPETATVTVLDYYNLFFPFAGLALGIGLSIIVVFGEKGGKHQSHFLHLTKQLGMPKVLIGV